MYGRVNPPANLTNVAKLGCDHTRESDTAKEKNEKHHIHVNPRKINRSAKQKHDSLCMS